MRQSILDQLRVLSLGSFSIAQELPRSQSGTPLYIKNPKRLYVDLTETTQNPLINTLDNQDITEETQATSLYFSVDAKTTAPNTDDLVQAIRNIKNSIELRGANRREVTVDTEYQDDLLVYTITFALTRIT